MGETVLSVAALSWKPISPTATAFAPDDVSLRCSPASTRRSLGYTWKRENPAVGAKAVRCSGGDLGPWVQLVTRGHIYTLVSSIPNEVCFKIKWGRRWAS